MEGRDWADIDWQRHALFCSFGFGYLGCWQHVLYNVSQRAQLRPRALAVRRLAAAACSNSSSRRPAGGAAFMGA